MASTSDRTCGECEYLVRTHPEQVFLKCRFWCGSACHAFGADRQYGHDYAVTHCHMQPWASACPFWLRKEIGESK